MSSKFERMVIPLMTLIIMTSQLVGCEVVKSSEMVKMLNEGQDVSIELAVPSYSTASQGTVETIKWTQLDQLQTYLSFREDMDKIFNINVVTENNVNGKSGCLYVDAAGDRDGNTTLEDAFRNEIFITQYWNNSYIRDSIAQLASSIFTDEGSSSSNATWASMNAYWNLMPDADYPNAFNGNSSLTREQFYTLLYKAETPVTSLKDDESFDSAIGGATKYSKYAQNVAKYGFLKTSDTSLNEKNYSGNISRAEAVYMIVQKDFSKELAKVKNIDKAFKDTKNAGDLSYELGFDKKVGNNEVGKNKWEEYTLEYMIEHPNDGMQNELYKAMVVAKEVGLISGNESRWDEPISKSEAIELLANDFIAQNKLYGYKSTVEYGKMNISKFTIANEGLKVLGVGKDGTQYGDGWAQASPNEQQVNPNEKLPGGLTLLQAKQIIYNTNIQLKNTNMSQADINAVDDNTALGLGTTMAVLNKIPDSLLTTTQANPANSNSNSSNGNQGNSGKNNYSSNQGHSQTQTNGKPSETGQNPAYDKNHIGVPGSYPKTAQDKDGDGLIDSLEGSKEISDGYTPDGGSAGLNGN